MNIDKLIPATRYDVKKLLFLGERIMSVISDFAESQNAYNDKMDASLAALALDVQGLNDEISKLQASQTSLSAEDLASLEALSNRSKSLSEKLAALDDLTPPVAPVDESAKPTAE